MRSVRSGLGVAWLRWDVLSVHKLIGRCRASVLIGFGFAAAGIQSTAADPGESGIACMSLLGDVRRILAAQAALSDHGSGLGSQAGAGFGGSGGRRTALDQAEDVRFSMLRLSVVVCAVFFLTGMPDPRLVFSDAL